MWTPRRILLLAFGAVLAFAAYTAYASCLGGIDGLPPLPEVDWPNPNPANQNTVLVSHGKSLDEKLVLAFGPECPQLKCSLKLEMNQKSMVVTARVFTIEDGDGHEGQLKLDDLSLALFKDEKDPRGPEINTVRAKTAWLTFDKPLGKNEKDLGGNRHIVAAELNDDIEIVNNHHTSQRDDDLHLIIDKGPLYYDEAKHLIWTADNVHIEDDSVKPNHNDVRGQGMEVHLAQTEAAKPDKPGPRGKPKPETFSGVERIVLPSNVDMNLYLGSGGFLNTSGVNDKGKPAPAAPPAAPAEPSHLSIRTDGRFEYTLRKDGDLAVFDVPMADAGRPDAGRYVTVVRDSKAADGKGLLNDQLNCQHLELRMAPKEGGPGAARDGGADRGMEVQSAHATGEKEVILVSDAEGLTAGGFDLFYDSHGQLTILKGDPQKPDSGMWADSKGSLIHAREMRIEDVKGPGGRVWRRATAQGPGRLDMQDGDKKEDKRPIHATWQDKLISTKDGDQDLMILTGSAVFVDEAQDQTLGADTLKVWLPPADAGKANATPSAAPNPRRPNHVQAINNVTAKSRDMVIPHAGQLVVWFQDVHDEETLPPAAPLAKANPPAVRESAKPATPAARGAEPPPPPPGAAQAAPNAAKADDAPPRPIDLTARNVYAWVDRGAEKNTLKRLQAEGDVVVLQAPATPDEKGVDIRGAALDMTYHPDGNFLVVQGDLAQLQMDKIYIVGPEVNIDQAANKAWVIGAGAMQMESASNFQGEKLAKPVPMTVEWKKEMFFTGATAEFDNGIKDRKDCGVTAEQDNGRLACRTMQVVFDHPISLKEGNHGGPPPRVKSLSCSHEVSVEDRTFEGERLVRSSKLTAPDLAMNAIPPDDPDPKAQEGSDGNEVRTPGPGTLRIYQRADAGDDPLGPPHAPGGKEAQAKPPAKPKPGAAQGDEPMKLTCIAYGAAARGSMYANTKTNHAVFLDHVRVLDMPCDDPNLEVDLDAVPDHLREGAMYLSGDRLDVFNHGDKTRSQKEMIAKGHVYVQSNEFSAHCDLMTYNEAKDQVIFEANEGGVATLYKIKQRGAQPQKIEGKKIIYIRSTGRFQIDGGDWISGESN